MIIPCIDLMDRKVVQLVQGREKALEGDAPLEMLRRFAAFAQIQVIDLDAAMGRGSNDDIVRMLAACAVIRAGGGVRTPERAASLLEQGAHKIIVGTSAFTRNGPNHGFLKELVAAVPRDRIVIALDSKGGRIVVKGWVESTDMAAETVVNELEQYCGGFLCTYVDKEGMMQGTDLGWFGRLRHATQHEITAAGGITTLDDIRALARMRIHSAVGMAVYSGRLDLDELARMNFGLNTPAPRLGPEPVSVLPIGYVRAAIAESIDDVWGATRARIELDPRFGPESLRGLDAFSHVEVLFHIDRIPESEIITGARRPRNREDWPEVGVFAQRAKRRPNRIGSTVCRLVGVRGTTIEVSELDAIDGTPVIDIKPYIREFGPKGEVYQPAWATELMSGYWKKV